MSKRIYQTFDAIHMTQTKKAAIREVLSTYPDTQEEKIMQAHHYKISRIIAVAATVVLALTLLGFTFGPQIIQLLGGGRLESGINSSGEDYASMDTGFVDNPAEVRDGRIYFVLDGTQKDITNLCSTTSYFQYENEADGVRHVIIVGGTVDSLGWAEYVFDKDGSVSASNASYCEETEPQWLTSADAMLCG